MVASITKIFPSYYHLQTVMTSRNKPHRCGRWLVFNPATAELSRLGRPPSRSINRWPHQERSEIEAVHPYMGSELSDLRITAKRTRRSNQNTKIEIEALRE